MNKLISLFMLSLFVTTQTSIALADEPIDDGIEDGDFVEVVKGEAAPFDGFLFDHGGISAQIAKQEAEKEILVLEKETEIKKVKIELETELKKKDAELDSAKKLNEEVLKLNKEELKTAQAKLERVSWVTPTAFISGIVTGVLLTISVLKVAVQVTK